MNSPLRTLLFSTVFLAASFATPQAASAQSPSCTATEARLSRLQLQQVEWPSASHALMS